MLNRIARHLTSADESKLAPDQYPDFWREYREYCRFWECAWDTFPTIVKQLAEEINAPNASLEEPLSGRCPCCLPANRPIGVWINDDGHVVPATPLGEPAHFDPQINTDSHR
jgi:hypothetical protein